MMIAHRVNTDSYSLEREGRLAPADDKTEDLRAAEEFGQLDTGQLLLLHRLFSRPPPGKPRLARDWLLPYVASALIFFVVPCAIGLVTRTGLTRDPQSGTTFGFLNDLSVLFSTLITIPVIVSFLLAERKVIPGSLAAVVADGALVLSRKAAIDLRKTWETRYRKVNVAAQVCGAVLAIFLTLMNHSILSRVRPGMWYFSSGGLTPLGWYALLVQQPVLWWVISIYAIRATMTIVFLSTLARKCAVSVDPFHRDKAGGLRPIGSLGLRNHYVLVILALNLFCLWVNVRFLHPDPVLGRLERISWGLTVYAILGPLLFTATLLPFRKKMLQEKRKYQALVEGKTRGEYQRAMNRLAERGVTEEVHKSLERLRDIRRLIDEVPVWPFDARSLRRFIVTYLIPIVAFLVSPVVHELMGRLFRSIADSH